MALSTTTAAPLVKPQYGVKKGGKRPPSKKGK
jgi:hypothetical protein